MVMYLIGALYAELGDRKKAVLYLSNIVGDKKNPITDAKLAKDARRLWQAVREQNQEESAQENASQEQNHYTVVKKAAAKPKKKSGLSRWF